MLVASPRRARSLRTVSPTVVQMSAEYWPYARTGGLGEAVAGLSDALVAAGVPTAVVVPLYNSVREAGLHLEVARQVTVRLGGREERGTIFKMQQDAGPDVYFVDHPELFRRPGIYGEDGTDYPDNARRFGFFCAAVVRALPHIVPHAAVLHAHDWHTALAPVYLRTCLAGDEWFDRIATVMSVHNAAYQGQFGAEAVSDLGLPASVLDWRMMEWYGQLNWLKGALEVADRVVTVSPTHARELATEAGGFGLHDAFSRLGGRLEGILNGIDTACWDPSRDRQIAAQYDGNSLTGKDLCRVALRSHYGLPGSIETPLVAMSARMVAQKGLPIILESLQEPFPGAQFVFLGRGDAAFENALRAIANTYPDRVRFDRAFSDAAEHRLLAGADMLLMPSLFEPCGLTQMRAQRYGTIPVARRVGGLADTIHDNVTGFLFEEYSPLALRGSLLRAVRAYGDSAGWRLMMRSAMRAEFGWAESVRQYRRVYAAAAQARGGAAPVARPAEVPVSRRRPVRPSAVAVPAIH